WLKPLPDEVVETKVPEAYSHLMTFIGGGRARIGFKFSELEMSTFLCFCTCSRVLVRPLEFVLQCIFFGMYNK
ncbi:hypothetical protein FA13DRAFT_1648570, partial [Coprinellus micaceus]